MMRGRLTDLAFTMISDFEIHFFQTIKKTSSINEASVLGMIRPGGGGGEIIVGGGEGRRGEKRRATSVKDISFDIFLNQESSCKTKQDQTSE